MRIKLHVIMLLVLAAVWAGADEKPAPSGKGMELYSWKSAGKDWHFSLIVGVNNRKPVLEIEDVEKYAVPSVAALKKKLSRLPKGEIVYWVNLSREQLPKEVEMDLRDYCRSIRVEFKPTAQNKPAAGNARSALRFAVVRNWPGLPEPGRWAQT